MLATAVAGAGMGLPMSSMAASCSLEARPRTLVNLMLYGGMDSRFIFMPSPAHYSSVYIDKIWAARKTIYSNAYTDYGVMFEIGRAHV